MTTRQMKTACAALLFGVVLTVGTLAQGAFFTPVNVTTTSNVDGNAVVANLINHNGLTTVGQHTNAFATQNHWRTTSAPASISLTFDLGATFDLAGMRVWNYNESGTGGGGAPNTDRGLDDVTISYSYDGVAFSGAQNFNLTQAPGVSTYAGEDLAVSLGTIARYIKLDVNTSHGSNNGFTGLSEMRFDVSTPELVPVSVSHNQVQNGGGSFPLSSLTDDTGMTGFGNEQSVPAETANGYVGQWRLQEPNDGNSLTSTQVTFDLGRDTDVGAIKVWNYNEVGGVTTRGIQLFDLYQSDDNSIFSLVGQFTLTQATGTTSVQHDVIDLNSLDVNAQYLRFDFVSDHGGSNGFYGLGEVRFFSTFVPEPTSLALLGIGGLGLLRRRRAARAQRSA